MPDLRESVDTTTTPADAARVRELDAVADAKAFDPRTPTYNPADHASAHRREADPTPGLNSPVLLSLSAKVRAASAERFEPDQPTVAGTAGPAADNPRREPHRPEGAIDAPLEDDFGPIDADRYREVPCVEQRPQRVYEVGGSDGALTEAEAVAITDAREKIAEVLDDASGDELTADDVQEALQYINPTRATSNCVECAKAVDDVLRGRASAAGPTEGQSRYHVQAALSARSSDAVDNVTSAEIERLVTEAGPGARGIVVAWQHQNPAHAYNVANIGGEVYWLDGQSDLMTEHDPFGFSTFDFYWTGDEGQQ